MTELNYNDLYEGQKVFIVYEKEGCVWSEETRSALFDGVETVYKDEKGDLYTVDSNGSKLTDLKHYLEIEGIKIYPETTVLNLDITESSRPNKSFRR